MGIPVLLYCLLEHLTILSNHFSIYPRRKFLPNRLQDDFLHSLNRPDVGNMRALFLNCIWAVNPHYLGRQL